MKKRVRPALQKYLMCFIFTLAIANNTHSAFAQSRSGSLVVMYRADDKVIVGADSLLTINNPNGSIDHEYNCKVVALGDYMIFASTGYFGERPQSGVHRKALFVFGEAKAAYSRMKDAVVGDIAKSWADAVIHYATIHDVGPNSFIRRYAVENNGIPIQAMFVDARPMGMFTALRIHVDYDITKAAGRLSYGIDMVPSKGKGECLTPIGPYCSGGETNSLRELIPIKIPQGQPALERLDDNRPKSMDPEAWRTKRLTELAIANDRSGHIGGRVDVAVLRPGREIEWISSPNCHHQHGPNRKK